MTPGSRWQHRQTWPASSHNHVKITAKIWTVIINVRNRVKWKSHNHRIKETIPIQTGRRGTDSQWAGPTPMWIKIWEGYLGSEAYTILPSLGFQRRLCHWTQQDTYYIRPHYQDTESNLYLTHRNKHREAAKMRQRNMVQMKEQIKTPEK